MKRRGLQRLRLGFAAILGVLLLSGCSSKYMVLDPAGPVGKTESHLIILSAVLVTAVIVPVIGILFFIIYRYRDKPGNKAPYRPNWDDSKVLEIIWWTIPIIIIAILGTATAKTTYALTNPPIPNVKPLTIQVTSLDWKWLFQYPDQQIATVNYAEIPQGVPVQFILTANAPMNSFWVPQLGGQEYTMPGMAMRLWLQADKTGEFFGSGANFTGKGFAHMRFKVISKNESDFNQWVKHVKATAPRLTAAGYKELTHPGLSKTKSFSSFPAGIFKEVVKENGGRYMHNNGVDHKKTANTSY